MGHACQTHACQAQGCDKAYTTTSSLRHHVRAHHLGIKLTCKYCGKESADPSDARRHQLSCKQRPANEPVNQYVCAWWPCTHKSTRSDNAVRHIGTCASRPAYWVGDLPAPIKVLGQDQVGGVMPDITNLQVLPLAQGGDKEEAAEGENVLLDDFLGAQDLPPFGLSLEEQFALPLYTSEWESTPWVYGDQWAPPVDGVSQEPVVGFHDFNNHGADFEVFAGLADQSAGPLQEGICPKQIWQER
ncbi:hypothetical protein A1O3_05756 [Capronia epimyces CBS 606.96]|uniref:C2H2-type domain-containing protein n=1 Tax=Capronia epimyces CBS 606.96 TaxID=1182542 RepID=W9Y758_9EURO|nr:uncharacterized protein A1O3_05756 [Capronia epimyces CBS 606.96]EXJ85081.1 hypothetical protein A1O3_05756 [Capronia epimyces CBS 606.96]